MASWNYRIVRLPCGSLVLYEVFYENGRPVARGAEPATFACMEAEEGWEGIARSLEMALVDARTRVVLDDAAIGRGSVAE